MTTPFAGTLKVAAPGDREIVMTRDFDAPRALVFDAFTKPELVKRWLLGPPGWSMPVCEIDLRVGGRYRYVWKKESKDTSMGVSGVYREVSPPARLVHTERFDESWYPGEAVITTEFAETPAGTSVTMTMLLESREARDGVLKSGMESGVAVSYDRLAEILDEPQILHTTAGPIATIHVTVPRAEIQKVMGPGHQELMAAVAAQGVAVTGPWFTHHLKMDPAVFDFEIGVPVASPVSPTGRVKPGTRPAAKMARTVYRGGYEGLGPAWGKFDAWVKAEGHTPAQDLWERYLRGPESGPATATYRTEFSRPLIG
jgi:uncharacterized protein YndB with AHSA1/START domain/effector-binding domain-containing protein